MKINYDEFNVPILRDAEIEYLACSLITEFDVTLLTEPRKLNILELFEYLKKKYKLKINFKSLGQSGKYQTLGRTVFSKNHIYLDNSLTEKESESLFLFTGAHEIGHWFLHRHEIIRIKPSQIEDQVEDFEENYGRKELVTPIDWIEHHANVFAASLLMPQNTFQAAIRKKQTDMGITRNLGRIYLDNSKSSYKDFLQIILHLHKIFGTSQKSIQIRMKGLGLLDDSETKPKHILNNPDFEGGGCVWKKD